MDDLIVIVLDTPRCTFELPFGYHIEVEFMAQTTRDGLVLLYIYFPYPDSLAKLFCCFRLLVLDPPCPCSCFHPILLSQFDVELSIKRSFRFTSPTLPSLYFPFFTFLDFFPLFPSSFWLFVWFRTFRRLLLIKRPFPESDTRRCVSPLNSEYTSRSGMWDRGESRRRMRPSDDDFARSNGIVGGVVTGTAPDWQQALRARA